MVTCFSVLICGAVVAIVAVLSLHCADLCKCLGADLRHYIKAAIQKFTRNFCCCSPTNNATMVPVGLGKFM